MSKKILIAINAMNVGGAPTVVLEHARFLHSRGFRVHILTLYPSKEANLFEDVLAFLPNGHLHEYNLRNRSIFDVKTLFSIYLFLRREKFDAVFTHLFVPNLLLRSLSFLSGVRCIFSYEHSTYDDKKKWQIIADRILSYITTYILVSNKAVAFFTARQEHIDISKFRIVPTPIRLPTVSETEKEELRRKIDITGDRLICLTVGRFSEEKGHDIIIEAASTFKPEERPLFLFVGHGGREADLRKKVLEKGLTDDVIIMHDPENAKKYLFIADVFILSSRREGQSLVVCEAMAAGLPVIASNLPTLREYIRNGENGYLFAPGHPDALREALRTFLCSEEREKMGQSARETFDTSLNENRLEILDEMLSKCG